MQSDGIIGIGARRLGELVGDFRLGRAEYDTRLALALGLRLPAHRVLQGNRDPDIADLDRPDPDPPIRGLRVDCLAQLIVRRPAV